jgi:hypothetical protein
MKFIDRFRVSKRIYFNSIQKMKDHNISWFNRPGSQKANGSGLKLADSLEWWSAGTSVR